MREKEQTLFLSRKSYIRSPIMEKKIHEIMRGIMLDEHALDRSKSRGSFPEAEDFANYFGATCSATSL